jgi:thiosulfate/3-mercaptopyruvate sulfurtransferase
VTAEELARLLEAGDVTILDVRTPEEFSGEAGYPCDPRRGHVEGAVNVEWMELYAGAGTPLPADAIRALLAERGADPDRAIVAYCHSGQRSAFAVTALRAAGLEAENYEGGWHEWSRR